MKRNLLLFGGAIFGVIAGSTLMRMALSGFKSGTIINSITCENVINSCPSISAIFATTTTTTTTTG